MTELLRRLHIWVGLFNLTVLIVFAATGIAVTLYDRVPASTEVRVIDYEPRGHLTDKEVADELFRRLAIPLAAPIPEWALHRNDQNALVLAFYSPNGVHRVTVLEEQRQVRVEQARNSLGEFMNAMHSATFFSAPADLRLTLWGVYIDLSIFSLLFMAVTGVWLWLASRPRLWWARASFATGAGLFIALWFVTR